MSRLPRPIDRSLSVLFAAAVFFFILTFSIALPIYCRFFYYIHIEALALPVSSGFEASQIMDAYNEVLDYLTLPGQNFGTGVMICSAEAQVHFEDCKMLFDLNAGVLLGSAACIAILLALRKAGVIGDLYLGRRSGAFWGAAAILVCIAGIGCLAVLDFDQAFDIFHMIFFPGKDNWIFNWNADQIIRILPQAFFRNCAILIGSSILMLSLGTMLAHPARKGPMD